MENEPRRILKDNDEADTRKEVVKSLTEETLKGDSTCHLDSSKNTKHINHSEFGSKINNVSKGATQGEKGSYVEFNMEAAMSSDDVTRAGGFGARDDINSFLPVASDSTDFEASLRDAREYEDPQEQVQRPGLGYTK